MLFEGGILKKRLNKLFQNIPNQKLAEFPMVPNKQKIASKRPPSLFNGSAICDARDLCMWRVDYLLKISITHFQ